MAEIKQIKVGTITYDIVDKSAIHEHQDISGKEDLANKVSAWSTTTTDAHYPSEKLVKTALDTKVDKVSGKGLSTNDYTTTEKNKLAGIASGAEVNQNAFSNVVVGSTTIAADSKTDSITFVAGNNVTLTPDATNDTLTISAVDTKYTLPVATSGALGGVKSGTDITVDSSGNVSVNDDSHNHVISNVDGLQSALDGKQAALSSQTAYTAKGSATKVPQITTNSLGQVTGIKEVTITQPTVNNGKLTIQAGGSEKGSFTANQSANTTINITAADLGLDAALRYVGVGQSSAPTAGQYIHDKTSGAYIPVTTTGTATEIDAKKGDVFTYNNKEYVMTTAGKYATPNASTELGDEGSYALKTVTITGTGALGGGGAISANRTITHNSGSAANKTSGLYKIATDAYSHVSSVTAVTKDDITGLGIPASDTNTTYTFTSGTNGFTVTPSGGSAQTVTVTPSITNNITGSGTSGYIAKFNGANTVTNGPAFGSDTATYLRNDGTWATPVNTKNTAGSTDTSSKIYLVGATSQAANPQTYSDNELYVTSGALTTKSVAVGGASGCTLQYSDEAVKFVFA